MKKAFVTGLLLASASLVLGSEVQAQVLPNFHGHAASFKGDGYGVPPGAVLVRDGGHAGQVCLKLCDGDTLPCDPIDYKHADDRCNQRDN